METIELKWKSEEQMQKELKEKIDSFKEGFSKDGYIESANGFFEYKGIKYLIKVLRYYNHTHKFTSVYDRVSDSHCVVEYPKETKELVESINASDEYSEFLWHDTLHSWNDAQTVEEQINECHRLAKQDIDSWSKNLKIIHETVDKFTKIKNKLRGN